MRITLMAIGVFLIWITVKLSCNDAVVFKLTNAVCETYNKSWFVFHQCRLRAINRNKTVFNLNGTVLHPAYDISVNVELFQRANGYKPWLVNITIDICRFMKKSYNPIAKLIFNLFKDFTNFNLIWVRSLFKEFIYDLSYYEFPFQPAIIYLPRSGTLITSCSSRQIYILYLKRICKTKK